MFNRIEGEKVWQELQSAKSPRYAEITIHEGKIKTGYKAFNFVSLSLLSAYF